MLMAGTSVVPLRLSLQRQPALHERAGVRVGTYRRLRGGDGAVSTALLNAEANPPPRGPASRIPFFRVMHGLALLIVLLVVGKFGSVHYRILTTLGVPSHPLLLAAHNGLILLLVEANVRAYLGVSLIGRRLRASPRPARPLSSPDAAAEAAGAVGNSQDAAVQRVDDVAHAGDNAVDGNAVDDAEG